MLVAAHNAPTSFREAGADQIEALCARAIANDRVMLRLQRRKRRRNLGLSGSHRTDNLRLPGGHCWSNLGLCGANRRNNLRLGSTYR
jgi:hypothetical protein